MRTLTRRERDVLRLLIDGYTNREVAERLPALEFPSKPGLGKRPVTRHGLR
jgi:FixJ family two-component response regulator